MTEVRWPLLKYITEVLGEEETAWNHNTQADKKPRQEIERFYIYLRDVLIPLYKAYGCDLTKPDQ